MAAMCLYKETCLIACYLPLVGIGLTIEEVYTVQRECFTLAFYT